VEIDKCRANSNVLMGRLLHEVAPFADYRIVALEGGSRETAIAAASTVTVAVKAAEAEAFCAAVKKLGIGYAKEYATTEPNMTIEVVASKEQTISALTGKSTELVHTVLVALPDSVQAMSVDMPGLVQTSTNFGLLKLNDDELTFANTIRSSITAQKEWIAEKIAAIVTMAGGTTAMDGNYPGWAYNPHSIVKDTILAAYEKLFGKQATVEAVHAGVECGLFADSIPNLDCVSIGPDMGDVHTPREHLSISSTERTYELLKQILADSK
jgi:dipeptidase D